MRRLSQIVGLLFAVLSAGCSIPRQGVPHRPTETAANVSSNALLTHIRLLASDAYEGRQPGTRGEYLAIDYVQRQFAEASFAANGPDGFLQQVPIIQRTARGQNVVLNSGSPRLLTPDREFIIQLLSDSLVVREAATAFAGYGIVAPEFGRDDYAGIDVRDKIVFVLAGEPDEMFDRSRARIGDDAMTALGEARRTLHRWDWVKQRNALVRGAKGIVIVVPDARLASKRQFFQQDYMVPAEAPPWAPSLSMMLVQSAFDRAARDVGIDPAFLQTAARSSTFEGLDLNWKLEGRFEASKKHILSHNVVAAIPGSGTGCVVVTAHWDGYGIDESLAGDNIWNGAVDDAGGVAQLLEIARQLRQGAQPRRTIKFVATTGEERGFIGARHFLAQNPCSGAAIAAVVNLDWFWELGRTRQFASHGLGYTTMDETLQKLAAKQGRTLTATNAFFAGGDQLPFMFAGIPGFHGGSTGKLIDRPPGFEEAYSLKISDGAIYREGNSNLDEVMDEWELSGAVEDAQLLSALIAQLANAAGIPCWKSPSQFSLKARECVNGKN